MVHKNIQALGALSVLALGHRAEAGGGAPTTDGLKVTFQFVKKNLVPLGFVRVARMAIMPCDVQGDVSAIAGSP